MTGLSPEAQAVKDAVIALYTDQQQIRDWGWRLDAPTVAAALRAAADQVTADSIMDGLSGEDGEGWYLMEERTRVAAQLLAIAAELEAQQ